MQVFFLKKKTNRVPIVICKEEIGLNVEKQGRIWARGPVQARLAT